MPNETVTETPSAARDGRALARARVPLPELGVIAASGPDAVAFLQAQLTNDVAQLAAGRMQLNGYCTAKGRLLATFHQWRHGDEVMLRLPREILPAVLKRLSMFVLRAKVKLADVSDAWRTSGLLGADLLPQGGAASLPTAPWTGTAFGDVRVDRVPGSAEAPDRWLLTAPAGAALPAWCEDLPLQPASLWWWSEIEAGVPTVFAATQEKFVPQMINFEVLGGVSFRKGCYPGQEIVARSQYLGKLKRRMQRAHTAQAEVAIAADVVRAGEAQPVGTVVLAAPSPHGGTDLLFEAPVDRLEAGTLHVGSPAAAPLELRGLPYELFDPTA